jgi:pseudouridine synthase
VAVIPRKKTLDRVLSRAGLGSRTEARRWIADGRVCVNGKKVQTPDGWVDPERDKVTFDGKPLKAAHKVYLLLYKPKGYLTTFKDPEGRPTVYDLLDEKAQWVFPVGRLDQDTSGLLLLTNDSEFGDYVSSPESHVPKTYLVKSSRLLNEEELGQLRQGLQLVDGPTRPATVERIRDSEKYTFFEITITEGRNRQVRRMVEALRAKVLKLVRVRIGEIRIGDLQIGTTRELTSDEVKSLGGRPHQANGGAAGSPQRSTRPKRDRRPTGPGDRQRKLRKPR